MLTLSKNCRVTLFKIAFTRGNCFAVVVTQTVSKYLNPYLYFASRILMHRELSRARDCSWNTVETTTGSPILLQRSSQFFPGKWNIREHFRSLCPAAFDGVFRNSLTSNPEQLARRGRSGKRLRVLLVPFNWTMRGHEGCSENSRTFLIARERCALAKCIKLAEERLISCVISSSFLVVLSALLRVQPRSARFPLFEVFTSPVSALKFAWNWKTSYHVLSKDEQVTVPF